MEYWSKLKNLNQKIFDCMDVIAMALRQQIQPPRVQQLIDEKVIINKTVFKGWALQTAVRVHLSNDLQPPVPGHAGDPDQLR